LLATISVNNAILSDNYVIAEFNYDCIFRFIIINIIRKKMKPSAPSKYVWIFGLIFGILGITGHYVSIDYLSSYNYLFLLVGFVLLAAGTTFKEL